MFREVYPFQNIEMIWLLHSTINYQQPNTEIPVCEIFFLKICFDKNLNQGLNPAGQSNSGSI